MLALLGVLSAQGQAQNAGDLTNERESIIQMIDSLEIRISEIDGLLSQVDPEDRLEAMISKYGKNKGKLIAGSKVWPTISFEMAKDSWGEPNNIQKSTLSTGSTEKWSYTENRYLYFKNGRLESWKE
jgi:hypothetical protein